MRYKVNPKQKLGVGLFNNIAPNCILSEDIEQKILSYLTINDIVNLATLNKNPWYNRMMEEIRRRKKCVTIYTWLAAETSSKRTQGFMGHSALRTYSKGKNGKGIYVSFYPGDCDLHNRHPTCQKKISHFHRWNQESRDNAIAIHIYGLDVDAIYQAFLKMHDKDMNSVKPWSPQYNCSDLVLNLLENANLFNQIDLRRYNFISLFIIDILTSNLFATSVVSVGSLIYFRGKNYSLANLFIPKIRSIFENYQNTLCTHLSLLHFHISFWHKHIPRNLMLKLLESVIASIKPNSILNVSNPFQYYLANLERDRYIGVTIISLVISFLSSFLLGYSYPIATFNKSAIPFRYYNPIALSDAIKVTTLSSLILLFENLVANYSRNFLPLLPLNIISKYIYFPLSSHVSRLFPQTHSLFIFFIPTLAPIIPVVSKFLYDTTTTPQQVLIIGKIAEKKLGSHMHRNNQSISKVSIKEYIVQPASLLIDLAWKNKLKTIGLAAAAATIGFFAYKNRNLITTQSNSCEFHFNLKK